MNRLLSRFFAWNLVVGRACPQRAAELYGCPAGALRTGAPYPSRFVALLLLGGCVLGGSAHAATVRLRLATLAPKDTSFHQSLQSMGEKWKQTSNGGVTLTIYTDGTMGGEADMVRRMRVGQIQAALISGSGLAQIDDSVTALQAMPMIYHSFAEFEYVQDRLRPMIEKRMLEKGFVMLFFGDAGWVKFFSKRPGTLPAEFVKMKMFAWVGDSRTIEVMKAVGVDTVALEQTDVLTGLQTGLIDVVPTIPVVALTGQFYGPASHVLDLNWTPLVGATVITKKAWDTVPEGQRKAMLAAAAVAGDEIRKRSRLEADEAIVAMQKRGLKVTTLTPDQLGEWRKFAETVYPKIRGKNVPADLFDEVQRLLTEFRAKPGAAAP